MSLPGSSTSCSEDENSRSPEESTRLGLWECEPLYYSLPGKNDKSRRGKAYRSADGGELRCFEAHDGHIYRKGDYVFAEATAAEPYVIGSIQSFKMTKRDQLSIKLHRFYRPDDVPEDSLSLILQERAEMELEQEQMDQLEQAHQRELFSSESALTYGIGALKGKCDVSFVRDLRSLGEFDLSRESAFVCCLSYNQETRRLAPVQGEIRVGTAFQAKLPAEPSCNVAEEPDRDELLYVPGQMALEAEQNYIRLTRSFRILTLKQCVMTETEQQARVGDRLMDDAIVALHRNGYDTKNSIIEMNANDRLLSSDVSYMTQDDVKKFGKGIKQYGKNFMKISRECLPLYNRDQLVNFYYLWKKSTDATKPKPIGRARNQTAIKRNPKKERSSRPGSTELHDYASASESEVEGAETEGKPFRYACHHCYESTSRDWHHAGRDNLLLLCTDCRIFYKKYGQLRPVDRPSTVPPCLFKRSSSGDEEEESGVRTRAGKKERKDGERRRTPSMGDERRSPSQAQSIHEFDLEKKPLHKNGKRKRTGPPQVNGSAKKKAKEELEENDEKEPKVDRMEVDASDDNVKKEEASESVDNGIKHEPVEENGVSDEKSSTSSVSSCSVTSVHQPLSVPSPSTAAVAPQTGIDIAPTNEPATPPKTEHETAPRAASPTASISLPNCEIIHDLTGDDHLAPGPSDDSIIPDEPFLQDDPDDGEATDEIVETTKNCHFILARRWKVGRRSARTDLRFRNKSGSDWDKRREEKRRKEAEIERAKASQQTSTALVTPQVKKEATTPSMAPTPANFAELLASGRAGLPATSSAMGAGLPPNISPQMLHQMMMQQQMMDQMAQQQQQHAAAQAAAAAAQQQQVAAAQQQQQMLAKLQQEMMRMQGAASRGAPGAMISGAAHFAGPHMGMPHGLEQLAAAAAADPNIQHRLQMELLAHQQAAQVQQAAAAFGVPPGMPVPPEIQMMIRNHFEAQAAAQQQAAALQLGISPQMLAMTASMGGAGLSNHPAMNGASDMMRRLQNEGFRQP